MKKKMELNLKMVCKKAQATDLQQLFCLGTRSFHTLLSQNVQNYVELLSAAHLTVQRLVVVMVSKKGSLIWSLKYEGSPKRR